jgi:hypothetical protein
VNPFNAGARYSGTQFPESRRHGAGSHAQTNNERTRPRLTPHEPVELRHQQAAPEIIGRGRAALAFNSNATGNYGFDTSYTSTKPAPVV